MGLRIKDPVLGMQVSRNLAGASLRVSRNFERLVTGKRINRAADNGADFMISTGMNSRLKVMGQVVQNVTDGVTLAQTADSALMETTLLMQEIRALAQESASAPLNFEERFSLQVEVDNLLEEIDHLGATTAFKGVSLLDGQVSALRLQSGPYTGDDITVRVRPINTFELGKHVREDGFEVDPTIPIEFDSVLVNQILIRPTVAADDERSVALPEGSAIAKAKAINDASQFTGVSANIYPTEVFGFMPFGGVLDEIHHIKINGVDFQGFEVLQADADKRLRNEINARKAETGVEATVDDRYNIILTAEDGRNIEVETTSFDAAEATGLNDGFPAVEIYAGALMLKSRSTFELDLAGLDMDLALGFGDGVGRYHYAPQSIHAMGTIDITNPEEANRAVEIIDIALSEVEQTRGEMEGVLGRLESTLNSTETRRIHLELSRRHFEDADYASELADYARNQIVQNAGVSVLAQANFGSNSALSLLRHFEGPLVVGGSVSGIQQAQGLDRAQNRKSGFGLFGLSGNPFGFDGKSFDSSFGRNGFNRDDD